MQTDRYGDPMPDGAFARMGTLRFGKGEQIIATTFSPDGKVLASGSRDNLVRLWEMATGKELGLVGEHHDGVPSAVAFSPTGKQLASGSQGGTISLWNVDSKTELQSFQGHQGRVYALAFSADGKELTSGGGDERVRYWNPATGQMTREVVANLGEVHSVSFAPDGKTLATGNWEMVARVCDLATSNELRRFLGHHNGVGSLAFSPDGRTLATGTGEGIICLWEVASNKERFKFKAYVEAVSCLAYAPDGRSIATSSSDGTILIWDVTGQCPQGRLQPTTVQPNQLDKLWIELGDDDGQRAYRTLWTMVSAAKQTVPLLKDRLRLLAPLDPKRTVRMMNDFKSAQGSARENAGQELERVGELAERELRAALKEAPPLDLRRRLDRLIEKLSGPVPSPETLQALRALEVLEQANTPDARQVLESLKRTVPDTRLGREATGALQRQAKRPAGF